MEPDKTPASENPAEPRSATAAWIALVLTLIAWAALLLLDRAWAGYIAIAIGVLAAIVGFAAMPGRPAGARRLAITAVIAAIVLVVVLVAFLVVIKVGLG